MRGLRTFRKARERDTLHNLGLNPYRPRTTVANFLNLTSDTMLRAFAESTDTVSSMQNPATGAFTFIIDGSTLDGPDTIA